jgi:hypothetical protein
VQHDELLQVVLVERDAIRPVCLLHQCAHSSAQAFGGRHTELCNDHRHRCLWSACLSRPAVTAAERPVQHRVSCRAVRRPLQHLTWVSVSQMWTWAERPTTDTRTRCCFASLRLSRMFPGSHVDSADSRISTCATPGFV